MLVASLVEDLDLGGIFVKLCRSISFGRRFGKELRGRRRLDRELVERGCQVKVELAAVAVEA